MARRGSLLAKGKLWTRLKLGGRDLKVGATWCGLRRCKGAWPVQVGGATWCGIPRFKGAWSVQVGGATWCGLHRFKGAWLVQVAGGNVVWASQVQVGGGGGV